jgi:RNA polymerase sigma-54 factor
MLKPSLQLKLGQQLTMTPQLQQAIRLLQLPALELQAHIRELLETNVMLEPVEEGEGEGEGELPGGAEASDPTPASEAPREAEAAADGPEETVEVLDEDWGSQSAGSGESTWNGEDEDRQQDIADAAGQSLQEYLLWQIELAHLAPRELAIARAIVDAVNDDGYLIEPLQLSLIHI